MCLFVCLKLYAICAVQCSVHTVTCSQQAQTLTAHNCAECNRCKIHYSAAFEHIVYHCLMLCQELFFIKTTVWKLPRKDNDTEVIDLPVICPHELIGAMYRVNPAKAEEIFGSPQAIAQWWLHWRTASCCISCCWYECLQSCTNIVRLQTCQEWCASAMGDRTSMLKPGSADRVSW